jgi:hypothetical protein
MNGTKTPSELSIRLDDSSHHLSLSPGRLVVRRGERVTVTLDCSGASNLLGVELHVPGNRHRCDPPDGGLIAEGIIDLMCEEGQARAEFTIGANAHAGWHEYRVYAHFKGSVQTIPIDGRPMMIVQ